MFSLLHYKRFFSAIPLISIALLFSGCADNEDTTPPIRTRKVKFELYTTQQFSEENNITFQARIVGNTVLWDSVFAPMQIKDIPAEANKIVFEKIVPENATGVLTVGFKYEIEDVGISWYYEKLKAEEDFKIVQYNFQ